MTLYVPGPAILFAPAGRPDIIPKAAAKADMVILDLEDGAGDIDRDQAYRNIRAANLDPQATIVRIVGPPTRILLLTWNLCAPRPTPQSWCPKCTQTYPRAWTGSISLP